jgi:hypothetical protein
MVFIGKILLGFQTSPLTFPFLFFSSFFFCKFWFFLFFCIFKNEQYQRQLNKKNQWSENLRVKNWTRSKFLWKF